MARPASISRLLTVLLLRSRRPKSHQGTDWTLVLALACTALTIASAVALVHYHLLNQL